MTETLTPPAVHEAETRDQTLVCTGVTAVTHDVKTFVLEPLTPWDLRHDAGQYLTFTFDIDGQTVERCYTISSPPTRPDTLTITVKRVPGGVVSNWLHDNLSAGRSVRATGPLGCFSMAEHPAPKYLFLSAGSGITPLMSMTHTLYDRAASYGRGGDADVILVHNARTPADIIFRHELDAIAATTDRIRVVPVCEDDAAGETWSGLRGRLSRPMLRQIAPDLHEREIFTCGPPPYLRAVREMLAAEGVDHSRQHEESFDLAGVSAPLVAAATNRTARRFTVEFSRSGRAIECDDDTFILDAALRAGLNVPSSCGEGVCGTCKSTLTSGNVDMQHAGGIRPREIDAGKILICCSRPLGDLTIDG